MKMEKLHWTALLVTDSEGDSRGTLGELVKSNPEQLGTADILAGQIIEWPQFFLSAPGEEPDWDTPHAAVDWTGFDVKTCSDGQARQYRRKGATLCHTIL